MSNKKRILLFWGYQRKAWVAPFEELKDHFNFSFLYYIDPSEEKAVHSDLPKIYWSDYSSAQDIIDDQRPDKIIFMGITGVHAIALNYVAKKQGISTAVVQHGLFHRFEKYLKLQEVQAQRRAEEGKVQEIQHSSHRAFLLSFYLRSVGFLNFSMLKLLVQLQLKKRKMNEYLALSKLHSERRLAEEYWVFTKSNADLYRKRDGVKDERMHAFGNPEMDAFFEAESKAEAQDYFLLVDQSFAEIKDWDSPGYGPTKEKVLEFYSTLQEYAEENGARLLVKLHPYSYQSDFYEVLDKVEFIKDAELVPLLLNAKAVFGFFSSLMLPAVYFKPCILFRMFDESDFINRVEALGLAKVLDYQEFEKDDIVFPSDKPAAGLATFENEFLFRADGKSTERLKELLNK